jgi:hypothetical protein
MAEGMDPYKKQLAHLHAAASDDGEDSTVPLVYYVNGVRYTVGTATLGRDGSFTGEIDQIHRMKVQQLIREQKLSAMSFSFCSPQDDPALG